MKLVSIMNKQEKIAATFKTVMEERSMTLVVFAEEIGIARISLQRWLKEKFNPQEDAIELLSEKLNASMSVLISRQNADVFDLKVAAKDELYPLLLPLLQQWQRIYEKIYRLSAELFKLEMLEDASRNE